MKRLRSITIAFILAVFCAVGLVLYHHHQPAYRGRGLLGWIQQAQSASDENTAQWQEATHAVQQIGPKAIPYLLELASARDSKLKTRLLKWTELHPKLRFLLKPARELHEYAYIGFSLLGDKARPAWPVFVQWTGDPDPLRRMRGLAYLAWSHPDRETYLPVFLRLIKDSDQTVQTMAIDLFRAHFPDDAKAVGVYGPDTQIANPLASAATTNKTGAVK